MPIEAVAGAHGGSRLLRRAAPPAVQLSFSEIAALIASLVALGPTATATSASAMRALVDSITPAEDEPGAGTFLGVSGSG